MNFGMQQVRVDHRLLFMYKLCISQGWKMALKNLGSSGFKNILKPQKSIFWVFFCFIFIFCV